MRSKNIAPQAGKFLFKAYRFELKHLRSGQETLLRRFVGAVRFCYNALLALCVEDYAEYLEELESRQCWGEAQSRAEARTFTQAPLSQRGQFALNYELKTLKQAHPFLRDCQSQVLQQKLADLHQAYENFFAGRSGRPQFKKKGGSDSIRFPQGFKLEEGNSRVYLPKIGWVSYHNSRRLTGIPKSVTVSHRAGKWYVSVLCELPSPQPLTTISPDRVVVLTPGVDCLLKSSEGEEFNLPEAELLKLERRLRMLRLRLRHKQPHSHRSECLKERIVRVQKRIADLRLNALHQISSRLLKNHELVVICPGSFKVSDNTAESGTRRILGLKSEQVTCLKQGFTPYLTGAETLLCRQFEYKSQGRGGAVIILRSQDLRDLAGFRVPNLAEGQGYSGLLRAGLARIAHERGITIPGQNILEVNSQGSQQCEPSVAEQSLGA